MFEARLEQGNLLKKVIEAIKDLVTDANLECTPEALSLQASKRTAVREHRGVQGRPARVERAGGAVHCTIGGARAAHCVAPHVHRRARTL